MSNSYTTGDKLKMGLGAVIMVGTLAFFFVAIKPEIDQRRMFTNNPVGQLFSAANGVNPTQLEQQNRTIELTAYGVAGGGLALLIWGFFSAKRREETGANNDDLGVD